MSIFRNKHLSQWNDIQTWMAGMQEEYKLTSYLKYYQIYWCVFFKTSTSNSSTVQIFVFVCSAALVTPTSLWRHNSSLCMFTKKQTMHRFSTIHGLRPPNFKSRLLISASSYGTIDLLIKQKYLNTVSSSTEISEALMGYSGSQTWALCVRTSYPTLHGNIMLKSLNTVGHSLLLLTFNWSGRENASINLIHQTE